MFMRFGVIENLMSDHQYNKNKVMEMHKWGSKKVETE